MHTHTCIHTYTHHMHTHVHTTHAHTTHAHTCIHMYTHHHIHLLTHHILTHAHTHNLHVETLCPVSTETPQENLSARLVDDVSTKSLKHNDSLIATIYLITPTYVRTTQKVDLTSLCYTFMHVPNLVWIVVEDAEQRTALVANLLSRCDLQYVHLNVSTSRKRGVEQSSVTTPRNISSRGVEQSNVTTPRRYLSKGVEQRNVGLLWLRKHCAFDSCNGVVYFADDDNTYDLRLFEMVGLCMLS